MEWIDVLGRIQGVKGPQPVLNLATGEAPPIPAELSQAIEMAFQNLPKVMGSRKTLLSTLGPLDGWEPLLQSVSSHWTGDVLITAGVMEALRLLQLWLREGLPRRETATHASRKLFSPASGMDFFGLVDPYADTAYGPFNAELDESGNWHLHVDVTSCPWEHVGAIAVSIPHTPSGRLWLHEEVHALAYIAQLHGVPLILDAAEHPRWLLEGPGAYFHPNIVYLLSFKQWVVGERVGAAVGPRQYMDVLRAMHRYFMIETPLTSQIAAYAGLTWFRDAPDRLIAWLDTCYRRWEICDAVF